MEFPDEAGAILVGVFRGEMSMSSSTPNADDFVFVRVFGISSFPRRSSSSDGAISPGLGSVISMFSLVFDGFGIGKVVRCAVTVCWSSFCTFFGKFQTIFTSYKRLVKINQLESCILKCVWRVMTSARKNAISTQSHCRKNGVNQVMIGD